MNELSLEISVRLTVVTIASQMGNKRAFICLAFVQENGQVWMGNIG
jgi:hypothetical protein